MFPLTHTLSNSDPTQKPLELRPLIFAAFNVVPVITVSSCVVFVFISPSSRLPTKPAACWAGQDVPGTLTSGQSNQQCWVNKNTCHWKLLVISLILPTVFYNLICCQVGTIVTSKGLEHSFRLALKHGHWGRWVGHLWWEDVNILFFFFLFEYISWHR